MLEIIQYVSENWTSGHVVATLLIIGVFGNYVMAPVTRMVRDMFKNN